MPELRPPRVPDTPDFRERVERVLRKAVRDRQSVPGLRWLGVRWSTAPGTAVAALLSVALLTHVPFAPASTDSSLPHWTAPQSTVHESTAPEMSGPSKSAVRTVTVDEENPLIDGRFDVDEFREPDVQTPTPSTVPQ